MSEMAIIVISVNIGGWVFTAGMAWAKLNTIEKRLDDGNKTMERQNLAIAELDKRFSVVEHDHVRNHPIPLKGESC